MSLFGKSPCPIFRHALMLAALLSTLALSARLPALAGDEPAATAPAVPPAADPATADKKPGGFQVEVPQSPTPKNPVPIGYIRQMGDHPRPASRLDAEPSNAGIAGAKLANDENNAGGQFTGEFYSLDVASVASAEQAVAEANKLYDSGHHFMIVDAPAETLLALSDWGKDRKVLF